MDEPRSVRDRGEAGFQLSKMPKSCLSFLFKWVAGFGISVLAIWAITAVCHSNYIPEVWEPEVDRNVPLAGWKFRYRYESWATTKLGRYGIPAVEDLSRAPGDTILVWGDSFAEAHQVPDEVKFSRQLTRLWNENHQDKLTVAPVGRSSWSVADSYFFMSKYEEVAKDCRLHVFLLYRFEDTLPDRDPTLRVSLFLSEPEFHFERYDEESMIRYPPEEYDWKKAAVFKMNVQFFLKLVNQIRGWGAKGNLRFGLGPAANVKQSFRSIQLDYLERPPSESEAAWEFLFQSLKKQTDLPILFVYSPINPTVEDGKILLENPEAEYEKAFSKACAKEGIYYLSLEDRFVKSWTEDKEFPRGFHYSRPWSGHYNKTGHRIVAESIYEWLKANPDVIHPD